MTPEADKLSKETAALRALADGAGVRGDWQLQLQAWRQVACIAPRRWRLLRDEPLRPKFEDAIPALAEAYAALLDDDRLYELWELVDAVPELRALYSVQVADAQARLLEYRKLYALIEENPGMDQPAGAAQLIHHAAKFGIVTRKRRVDGYTVTYHGVPIIDAERIDVSHIADLTAPVGESRRKATWFERLVAWMRFPEHRGRTR